MIDEDRRASVLRVQLRLPTKLTCEAYINQHGWKEASLSACPWHPRGGCGFASHGHYERQDPEGLWIRRWYCPKAHQTVSLLPDFAAARLTGTLAAVEQAVADFEEHRRSGCSVAEAAQELRPDIELPGALRWIRRRCRYVHAAFVLLMGCAPELIAQVELSVLHVRAAVGAVPLMVAVREIAHLQLQHARTPVGFAPRAIVGRPAEKYIQHATGPDPPVPTL